MTKSHAAAIIKFALFLRLIRVDDQAWRKLYPGGRNLLLNSPLEEIKKHNSNHIIFFVHTGKCAGESILIALRKTFKEVATIIEYHCFDANRLIKELLLNLSGDSILGGAEATFVIATRDPLDRWVSSFNWELYNRFLRKSKAPLMGYRKYPSVLDLAHGIINKERSALTFGRSGHMGMGISWYLPRKTLTHLSKHKVYSIRMENIYEDFNLFASDFVNDFSHVSFKLPVQLPRTKGSYQQLYPKGTFADLKTCKKGDIDKLRHYLRKDYRVNRYIVDI